jgi:predicted MarR family transcription regulator
LLKRLRTHGLVKKAGHTYNYYVTAFGKEVVATALKLRELVIIPQLLLEPPSNFVFLPENVRILMERY